MFVAVFVFVFSQMAAIIMVLMAVSFLFSGNSMHRLSLNRSSLRRLVLAADGSARCTTDGSAQNGAVAPTHSIPDHSTRCAANCAAHYRTAIHCK